MSFRTQFSQPEVDLAPCSSSSAASSSPNGGSAPRGPNQASAAYSNPSAPEGAQDSGSISAVPEQLSGDVPIRQDRVDALRAQVEAGTYTVNSHALAKAMFESLFRS